MAPSWPMALLLTMLGAAARGLPPSLCSCRPASLCRPLATPLPSPPSQQLFAFGFPAAELRNRSAWLSWPWDEFTTVGLVHEPPANFVCYAHAHGVRVVQNVAAPRHYAGAAPFLRNATAQQAWVRNNLETAQQYGLDGLSIDIESNQEATRDHLSALVKLTAAAFRAENPHALLAFSATMYPFANYSKASPAVMDYRSIADSVDTMFIMAYDTFGSPSVAHGGGRTNELAKGLAQYIRLGVSRHKLVIGIGAFGFDFPCAATASGVRPEHAGECVVPRDAATGMAAHAARRPDSFAVASFPGPTLANLISDDSLGLIVKWDASTQQPFLVYEANRTWHQCWFEDAQSIQIKRQMGEAMQVGGMGVFLADFLSGSTPRTQSIWAALATHKPSNLTHQRAAPSTASSNPRLKGDDHDNTATAVVASAACPSVRVVWQPQSPAIDYNISGELTNLCGLEDGIVIHRRDGSFSMIAAEIYAKPRVVAMRLGVYCWQRTRSLRTSLVHCTTNCTEVDYAKAGIHAATWRDFFVRDPRNDTWMLSYVGYRTGHGDPNYQGTIFARYANMSDDAGLDSDFGEPNHHGDPYDPTPPAVFAADRVILQPDDYNFTGAWSHRCQGVQGTDSWYPFQLSSDGSALGAHGEQPRWAAFVGGVMITAHARAAHDPGYALPGPNEWQVSLATAPALSGPWSRYNPRNRSDPARLRLLRGRAHVAARHPRQRHGRGEDTVRSSLGDERGDLRGHAGDRGIRCAAGGRDRQGEHVATVYSTCSPRRRL